MAFVDQICALAKAKDRTALRAFLQEHQVSVGVWEGNENTVVRLAKERDVAAIDFLADAFYVSLHDMVVGYAAGGHVEQVNALLAQGASRDWAVRGYAQGGYVEQVNALLAQGVSRDWAVRGYAQGGYVEQVNILLAQGANRTWAVMGYARGGYDEQVNALLAQGASRDWAVMGYARGGHVKQVNALLAQGANRDYAEEGYVESGLLRHHARRIMAYTNDAALRHALAQEAGWSQYVKGIAALEEATRLNHLMKEYDLTFKQAEALTIKGVRAWLLQGPQVIEIEENALTEVEETSAVTEAEEEKTNNQKVYFPPKLFIKITEMLTGLSGADLEAVFCAVNKNLYGVASEKYAAWQQKWSGLFYHSAVQPTAACSTPSELCSSQSAPAPSSAMR